MHLLYSIGSKKITQAEIFSETRYSVLSTIISNKIQEIKKSIPECGCSNSADLIIEVTIPIDLKIENTEYNVKWCCNNQELMQTN